MEYRLILHKVVNNIIMKNKSKKFAIGIAVVTTLLTAYAINQGLEGIGTAIWSTGIPSAVGLYINKQFQDRKWGEINNGK